MSLRCPRSARAGRRSLAAAAVSGADFRRAASPEVAEKLGRAHPLAGEPPRKNSPYQGSRSGGEPPVRAVFASKAALLPYSGVNPLGATSYGSRHHVRAAKGRRGQDHGARASRRSLGRGRTQRGADRPRPATVAHPLGETPGRSGARPDRIRATTAPARTSRRRRAATTSCWSTAPALPRTCSTTPFAKATSCSRPASPR